MKMTEKKAREYGRILIRLSGAGGLLKPREGLSQEEIDAIGFGYHAIQKGLTIHCGDCNSKPILCHCYDGEIEEAEDVP